MDSVLPVLLGYGLGSLPLGYLVASRAKGVDLRRVGSGNVGAANAYRSAGRAAALDTADTAAAQRKTSPPRSRGPG